MGKSKEGWRRYSSTTPRKIRARRGCAFWWPQCSLSESKPNPSECWG